MSNRFSAGCALVLGLCLAMAPGLQAADSDLSNTHDVPANVNLGTPFTVTVGYGNAGPDAATSAYINSYHTAPMGLDVFMDDLVNGEGAMYDAIQATAEGTDTLGNAPLLFWDDYFCEDLLFQLQRDDEDTEANPIEGLDPGVTASFSYDVTLPMESPRTGAIDVWIDGEAYESYTGSNPANIFVLRAGELKTYGRAGCDPLVNGEDEDVCEYIPDNCFGARVSQFDMPAKSVAPVTFELVDDGSANPTWACDPLVGFTSGNVALMRRGDCEFGTKAFNAEQAGAIAVFMVNDGRCSDFPEDDQCVINMGPGALGGLVTIPLVLIPQADGEEIITAYEGGQSVTGVFGSASVFSAEGYSFLSDSGDEDANEDNDLDAARATVSAIPPAPVASFTYSPENPTTGTAVSFTDTSTGGTPDTWAWDFGDDGTSTDQNPTHTYTTAGTFTVTLTASNAGGSSQATADVTVTLGETLDPLYWISAAALASGAEGSFFQTDVDVNNGGATGASYAFGWLPRGGNNADPQMSDTYTLAAGASTRYENVLSTVFEFEPDVSGALVVYSNSTELNIMSRTYNLPTAKVSGTFGQAIPGVPTDDLIGQNDVRRIIFMSENDDLRANVGCVNGANDNVPIKIDLYDEAGAMLASETMALSPYSNNQINQIFADYAPTNGYVDVSSIKASAAFYCYGSVLDNGSSDPTTILPTMYGADAPFVNYFIPAAALAAGLEGSFFQTDVDINNAGDAMATYNFSWLPRGANNSDPVLSESFTLAAGASVRYENVLSEVFGAEPDVAGALMVSADSADLGIMSRTYNLPTAKVSGTFGQAIPGIPHDMLIGQNEVRRIIFMSENDDLRANLGCVNGADDNVPIKIDLYDETGAMLGTETMALSPYSNNQINQIFGDYAPTNGYADISSIKASAAFYCYGSVLDNGSSDPTTILPQ